MVPTEPPEPSDPAESRPRSSPGRSVGRYEFLGELGSGAMGTVWRAHDTRLNREVAVKEVHLPHDMPPRERERARARMVREAQAAARVSHPSVVTVHDVLEADGVTFIVMELLDGESLRDRLKRSGPLSEAEVERIARPLLSALWAAHRAGVIHRDVKPANIMLSEGGARPVLTDFGIANLPDHEGTALTGTGTILGTAAYAAPERLESDRTSAVSDLWSLGATLFAALAGESPFKRDTLTATLTAVLTQPVPPVPARGRIASVVTGLLERDPRRRLLPEQALTVLEAPEPSRPSPEPHRPPSGPHGRLHAGPVAPPVPVAPAPPSGRSRAPLWIGAAVLAALLAAVGLTLPNMLSDHSGAEVAADDTAGSDEPEPSSDPSPEPSESDLPDDAPEGFVHFGDGVVELVLPKDWEVREGDAGGGSESATRLASYDFDTGVETGTATVVATRYDFLVHDSESAMLRMEELLRSDEDFSDVRQQRLDTEGMGGGLQSSVYEVLFHHEERDVQDRWMFTREITDETRGMSYRLSFNFPADLRDEYQEDFQSVLDSFGPDGAGVND
ncbi:serine/threonine-protein kinase [Nocardiopsis ganjiahuensis]|uniref:serine/threonine-protein kinase n=1 Tax=Nocardiopsis ganjiahuensis TaxID=239984 RepID=UPI000684A69C|nr:serine/threonine-protein kinase [Nocardiopsis ganjiahuensis]